jgi:anti-anti-sigma factor
MSLVVDSDRIRWHLPAEFNIYHAAELKIELETALAHDLPLTCVLDAVEEIDSSAVQLLLVAERAATQRGQVLVVAAASPICREACTVLGLQRLLETAP